MSSSTLQDSAKQQAALKNKKGFFAAFFAALGACIHPQDAHDASPEPKTPQPAREDDAEDSLSDNAKLKEKNGQARPPQEQPVHDKEKLPAVEPPAHALDVSSSSTVAPPPPPQKEASTASADTVFSPPVAPPLPSVPAPAPIAPEHPEIIVPPSPRVRPLPEDETAGLTSAAVVPPGATGEETESSDDGSGFTDDDQHDGDGEPEDDEDRIILNGGLGIPIGPVSVPPPLYSRALTPATGRPASASAPARAARASGPQMSRTR